MKALAITSKGIEDIAALEIKELIKAKTEIKDSCVFFEPKKLEDLCLLCYKAQSVDKILFLFDSFGFKDADDLINKLQKAIDKLKLDEWLDKKTTFRVSCKKTDNEEIFSEELSGEVGALIIKKQKQKVDLDNPDITFLLFINKNTAYFGVDFSGRDLHKRDYKVFPHPFSLRPTIAYALVRIAGFGEKEVMLDPFCYSGEIPIEAALFMANFPVNYYSKDKLSFLKFKPFKKFSFENFFSKEDKKIKEAKKPLIIGSDQQLRNVTAAKKNAKIAGIDKSLTFTRYDVDWLDIKKNKESIGKIITHPPELTKRSDKKQVEKLYDELFYQGEYILKKNGSITIISKNMEPLKKAAEKYKLKVKHEREVWCGKEAYKVAIFVK